MPPPPGSLGPGVAREGARRHCRNAREHTRRHCRSAREAYAQRALRVRFDNVGVRVHNVSRAQRARASKNLAPRARPGARFSGARARCAREALWTRTPTLSKRTRSARCAYASRALRQCRRARSRAIRQCRRAPSRATPGPSDPGEGGPKSGGAGTQRSWKGGAQIRL